MADVTYGSLPFKEQIAYFRRKLNVLTDDWTQLYGAAHDHAFVVAGANREDLLADLRASIDKAVSEGATLEQFRREFDAIVAKHGWDYKGGRDWRSRVIYETNLRASYAAGRWKQLQEIKSVRPYWRYRHSDAVAHPRPQHQAWDGLVLHADDPWWQTHFPPNGWGCQCTVEGLNLRDLQRLGKDGPDPAPPDNPQTVTVGERGAHPRVVTVPEGVDPGFGHAPGATVPAAAWMSERLGLAMESGLQYEGRAWKPLVEEDWRTLDRPEEVPLAPLPVKLGPPAADVPALERNLVEALGAPRRVFDVHGLPVAVDAKVLAEHIKLDRSAYATLVPDLLEDPWEVWLSLEQHQASGYYDLRARMIKGYDLGLGKYLLLAARENGGLLESWTWFVTSDRRYLNKQRLGLLWYGEE